MKYMLFGESYEMILLSKLIKVTPKTCLIHIASSSRMSKIFKANSIIFSEAIIKQYKYYYCSKMILKDK